MTAAPPHVHIVVPNFTALTEFPSERPDIKDDCGPCASEVCIAACERRAPATGNMIEIRSRDIQAGKFRVNGGQTLDELEWDVHAHTTIETTKTPLGSSVDAIHTALKAAAMRGNPCVLNLALATNLPGNEPDVHYHFIAIGGIDSNQGYLCANGDKFPFGHIGTYWVRWNPGIEQAQPIGLLEYHMPAPPRPLPPPVVRPIPTPVPASDDKLQLALRTVATQLSQAQATISDALK